MLKQSSIVLLLIHATVCKAAARCDDQTRTLDRMSKLEKKITKNNKETHQKLESLEKKLESIERKLTEMQEYSTACSQIQAQAAHNTAKLHEKNIHKQAPQQ